MVYLREEWDLTIGYNSLSKALKNRLYLGEYRGNPTYCEPIIARELFDRVQRSMVKRSFRKNPSNRVYVFSGLTYCSECGRHFTGCYSSKGKQNYRCNNAVTEKRCANHRCVSEKVLERYLLEHVGAGLDGLIAREEFQRKQKPRKKPDAAAINAKLDRLKDLYVDGLIDKQKYLADREKLIKPLQEAHNLTLSNDYAALRELVGKDFQARYIALSPQNKQAFWRALLGRIIIHPDGGIDFYFV